MTSTIPRAERVDDGGAAPDAAQRRRGLVLYRDRILVVGGECNNGKPFIENEAFDVKTGRWSHSRADAVGRHGIQAATDGQHGVHPRRRAGVRDRGLRHAADVHAALTGHMYKVQGSKWKVQSKFASFELTLTFAP